MRAATAGVVGAVTRQQARAEPDHDEAITGEAAIRVDADNSSARRAIALNSANRELRWPKRLVGKPQPKRGGAASVKSAAIVANERSAPSVQNAVSVRHAGSVRCVQIMQ